jgi:hypothetical protein
MKTILGGVAVSIMVSLVACSDDPAPGDARGESTPKPSATEDAPPPSTSPTTGASSPKPPPPAIELAKIADLDPAKGELPEALSYRDGFAYVSLAPMQEIVKVSIADGSRSSYAKLPVAKSNFVLGSIFDAEGNLFVGVGATNWEDAAGVAAAGVYKIAAGGSKIELFASSTNGMKFPNGLSFAPDGALYASDAADGAVYKIAKQGASGALTPWKKDASLSGDIAACPATVAGFPLGANGIYAEKDAVWVGNTDRGALVKIAIEADGSAGAITTVAQSCDVLEGLDGLRPDPRNPTGAFVGTNNPKHTIVSISRTGTATVLEAQSALLDGPADLVFATKSDGAVDLIVVNSAFPEAFAPPSMGLVPHPSIVKLTLR